MGKANASRAFLERSNPESVYIIFKTLFSCYPDVIMLYSFAAEIDSSYSSSRLKIVIVIVKKNMLCVNTFFGVLTEFV